MVDKTFYLAYIKHTNLVGKRREKDMKAYTNHLLYTTTDMMMRSDAAMCEMCMGMAPFCTRLII